MDAHEHHMSSLAADGGDDSYEEALALLAHLLHHSAQHIDEMRALARTLDGEAAHVIEKAARLYEEGNAQLEQALALASQEDSPSEQTAKVIEGRD